MGDPLPGGIAVAGCRGGRPWRLGERLSAGRRCHPPGRMGPRDPPTWKQPVKPAFNSRALCPSHTVLPTKSRVSRLAAILATCPTKESLVGPVRPVPSYLVWY